MFTRDKHNLFALKLIVIFIGDSGKTFYDIDTRTTVKVATTSIIKNTFILDKNDQKQFGGICYKMLFSCALIQFCSNSLTLCLLDTCNFFVMFAKIAKQTLGTIST